MRPEDNHAYEIAPRIEPTGSWGVFCAGCSYVSQTYVYPCRFKADHEDTPPKMLFAPEKVQDMLTELLNDMVVQGKALLAQPGYSFYQPHPGAPVQLVTVIESIELDSLSLDTEPNAFGESLHVVPEEVNLDGRD